MTSPIQTPSAATLPAADGSIPGAVLVPGTAGAVGALLAEPDVRGRDSDELSSASVPTAPALSFVVHGSPAPQGSKRGYVVNGRAVLVESSKKVRPWREAVKHAALDCIEQWRHLYTNDGWKPLTGPLMLTVVYTLPRPKSHYRTGRNAHLLRDNAPHWPATKPDVGKLTRATEDALTDSGVYGDDAQIVVSLSVKSYPNVHRKALQTPGAYVRITGLPPDHSKDV